MGGAPEIDLTAGALCLDFANTWEDRGDAATDRLRGYGDLLVFAVAAGVLEEDLAARLQQRSSERGEEAASALAEARDLRDAVFGLFADRAAGGGGSTAALATLNGALSSLPGQLCLNAAPEGFVRCWRGLETSLRGLLRPIAASAAELLASDQLDRVRHCHAEGCDWLFLDHSRNRSRRWCSMETCGNRSKARRHYHRKRAGEP